MRYDLTDLRGGVGSSPDKLATVRLRTLAGIAGAVRAGRPRRPARRSFGAGLDVALLDRLELTEGGPKYLVRAELIEQCSTPRQGDDRYCRALTCANL